MLINTEEVERLETKLARLQNSFKDVTEQLKLAKGNTTLVGILTDQEYRLKAQIRHTKQSIEWEKAKYDYLESYEEKLKHLSPYLGKEVKSSFISDENTPQILLGLMWEDGTPNYSSSRWVGLIRYVQNNRTETSKINIDYINPLVT